MMARDSGGDDYEEVVDFEERRIGRARNPDHTPIQKLHLNDPSRWNGTVPREREWIVENWIPMRDATLITGHGGLGKSILMMQLLFAVAAGHTWLGMGTRQIRAWGLFCEDEDEELHRRSLRIIKSMDKDFGDLEGFLSYDAIEHHTLLVDYPDKWARQGEVTDLLIELSNKAVGNNIQLIVLDSLYNFFGGDENNRPQVQYFVKELQNLAREIDGAVVMIGHPSKSGLATGDGTSGSTAWHNAFRSRLYLHPPKGIEVHDPENRQWQLTRMKGNYAALSDNTITVEWSTDGILMPLQGPTYLEEGARDRSCEELILAAIRKATGSGRRTCLAATSPASVWKEVRFWKLAGRDYSDRELEEAAKRLFISGIIEERSVKNKHRNTQLTLVISEKED